MHNSPDLQCPRCGGVNVGEVTIRNLKRELVPKNHCLECGLISEYIPTRDAIKKSCESMNRERHHEMLNDTE